MTSLLYWKSLELSNRFYNLILRYPLIVSPDQKQQVFVINQKPTHKYIFFCYLACMILCLLCYAVVIFETIVTKTMEMPVEITVATCFMFAIILVCLLLIKTYIGNNQIMFTQHLNNMLKFEKQVLVNRNPSVALQSLGAICRQGTVA